MKNTIQAGKHPLVSVIIPVFNRAGIIALTLDSVKAQTYRPIEILVVDDGSVDKSAQVIQQWITNNKAQNLTAYLIQQKNRGAPAARNHGLEKALGRYLQFLDSDDTLEPKKVEVQVEALEAGIAEIAICDFKYDCDDPENDRIVKNDGDLLKKLVSGGSIFVSTPLITATCIKNQIWWNERLQRQQDIDFMFKTIMHARWYVYTPGVWCNYVRHEGTQISDGYNFTAPQYGRRVLSLMHFMFALRNDLPKGRKLMVTKAILNLVKQQVRYSVKMVLRRTFGEGAVRWIKKFT